MDFRNDVHEPGGTRSSSRIETEPIRVLITTDDYEIDGFMHIKPGGYQSRISDILNSKGIQYLAVTNAKYYDRRKPDELAHKVETLIIRMDTIKMVAPQNGAELIGKDSEGETAESDHSTGNKPNVLRPITE